eukprot:12751_1
MVQICNDLLLLILLFLIQPLDDGIKCAVRFAGYDANPLGSFETMLTKPGTFENIMRIDPDIFLTQIVSPLLDCITLPRNYLAMTEYQMYQTVSKMRNAQICAINRTMRFWMCLRGVPFQLLAWIFDQHFSTVYRDFHHLSVLCVEKLSDQWLSPIIPNSIEYYNKIGQRAFRHFPNALYALDVVKCHKSRPFSIDHTLYRDGHHAAYTYGYLCAVDCDGQCRIAAGHYGGSLSDIETFYYSDLYANPGIYVGNGAKYLVDGIFARIDSGPHGHFITPFCYMQRRLTVAETRYNNIQAWDRSIVEHYFGRLKYWFPLVDNFRLSDEAINMVFRSCCIFTNIMIQYCKPLRK